MIASLRAAGAPEHVIEAARKKEKTDDVFYVHADNWDAVTLFRRMRTQWTIVVGFGVAKYEGINYTALESGMRMMRIPVKNRDQMWNDICIMENAALEVLNKE